MDFCVASSSIWQLAGYLLYVLKVLVPVIIIVLGIIDLTKALVASKDDALNTAIRSLLLRFIVGFAIFFVPLIISTLFTLIKDASPYIAKADACQICLLRPLSKGCGNYKTEAKNYRETQKENLNKPNSEGYKTEKEACYFCGSGYVWTSNGKGCQKVDKNIETDQIINNSALCEAMNESNLDFNHTDNSNQDDNNSSANKNIIFVGDSHINGICNSNSLSNCFYCVGGGYSWFTGSNCSSDANTGNNPINGVQTILNDNSSKKYVIVVLLGTNGLYSNPISLAKDYANKYASLIKNEWVKATKVVAVSIPPIKDEQMVKNNGYYISVETLNSFNESLKENINIVKKAQRAKIEYCDLNITASDITFSSDGLHLDNEGYQKIYNNIQNCL